MLLPHLKTRLVISAKAISLCIRQKRTLDGGIAWYLTETPMRSRAPANDPPNRPITTHRRIGPAHQRRTNSRKRAGLIIEASAPRQGSSQLAAISPCERENGALPAQLIEYHVEIGRASCRERV